ncbi:hypothetical protein AYO20_02367 [Fonsecaea nubica]|uniref:type II protein arginine methyltransferase n=1 Tax=Fonsecaea nubica TaxID=856822 RepID=A0A178D874_9EURO|nr:hypothetical protein AYO20_02367 [Fonsecaea nubica]OAL38308.1 hypothetical protein AYO20_02367 [Fonsecaea nubica]
MFTCDACLRRSLFSLGSGAGASHFPSALSSSSLEHTISSTVVVSRKHATLQSLRKGHHRNDLFKALKEARNEPPIKARPSNARAKLLAKDAQARERNWLQRLEPSDREAYLKKAMEKEARYLVDPLKLAQGVVEKLRDHNLQAALELVRASERAHNGKGVDNVVSWNHIIDWLMGQESPGEAWKVYNEMKKRGHKPDSHTYTIMLRGYRDNVKKPNAVQQALSVYDSISAANSAVTPTTIHTNAIISVCARAYDIDAIWRIAGRLPERGPGAPDHVTFTTILQALNSEAQKRAIDRGGREGPGFDPQPIFEQVIDDARKLWLDITARWRRGDLYLDEALVCAMGRLLMLSSNRSTHLDVLNLVHQAMNIGRMPEVSNNDAENGTDGAEELESTAERDPPTILEVSPTRANRSSLSSGRPGTTSSSVYATPGNNTLSMLMETTTALRKLKLGKYYWEILTAADGPYKIVPDHQNIMAYLRLLRVSRASRAALDLLRAPRPDDVQNKLMVRGTFVIAMSTCLRDKKNPNVFETASRIMDLMQESTQDMGDDLDGHGKEPQGQKLRFSPKALRMYLEVAMATTKGIGAGPLEKTSNGDLDFERDPSKNHTLRALRRLGPDVVNVRQLIKSHLVELEQQAAAKGRTIRVKKLLEKRQITPYSVTENIGELVELLRTMISAIDKIILVNERLEDEGMGPLDKAILKECWLQKRKLSAFVSRAANVVTDPKGPGELKARRVNERGQPLASRNGETSEGDGAAWSEDTEVAGDDMVDEDFDAAIPSTNPHVRLVNDIKAAQAKHAKSKEERGLSRRQKLELIKEEQIRAQFPTSVLRERQSIKERTRNRWNETETGPASTRQRSRAAAGFARKAPVWKTRQMEIKEMRREKRQAKEQAREAHESSRARERETYRGWGGGFQDMLKEHGRADRAGIVELGPHASTKADQSPSSVPARKWSTPLAKTIAQAIEVTGPISIASYMRQCLTNPDGGYYTTSRPSAEDADQFGAAGDFITSPEISQVFGELVGIWFMTEWMAQGRPTVGVQFVEMGPGRGTLMSDILRTIGQFKTFARAISAVWMVEAGEGLRKKQKDLLCGEDAHMKEVADETGKNVWWEATSTQGIPVRWVEDIALLPAQAHNAGDEMPFIIAHEFFDALPIHAFESVAPQPEEAQEQDTGAQLLTESGQPPIAKPSMASKLPQWRELLVAPTTPKLTTLLSAESEKSSSDRDPEPDFQLTLAKASTPSSLVIPERPRYRPLKAQVSSRVEVSPESSRYIQDFARRIGGNEVPPATLARGKPKQGLADVPQRKPSGAALIIDYGPLDTVPVNSLRAIRKHKIISPFVYAGDADISADVDFGALADAALEASPGVEVHGPVEQGTWLMQLGIKERAERLLNELDKKAGTTGAEEAVEKRRREAEMGWRRLVEGGPKGMGKAYKVMTILPENGGRRRPVGFGGSVVPG